MGAPVTNSCPLSWVVDWLTFAFSRLGLCLLIAFDSVPTMLFALLVTVLFNASGAGICRNYIWL